MSRRPPDDMTNRLSTPHAEHDLLLVAAHAAGDTLGVDAERATTLVTECPDCAALAADLIAIAKATHDLPAPVRPRDFTLRPEDAARLRSLGWRRLAAALGTRRLEVMRPLAAGLTTLGLAGILLAGLPLAQGQAGGATVLSTVGAAVGADSSSGGASVAAAPGASAAPSAGLPDRGAITPVASPSAGDQSGEAASPVAPVYGTEASPAASGVEGTRYAAGQPASSPPPRIGAATLETGSGAPGINVPLLAVSLLLLVVGVGLLLLGRATKNAGGA